MTDEEGRLERLGAAIKLATDKHHGQFDKARMPYIMHPFRVMNRLANEGAPETLLIAAMLHDTVEDTDLTLRDIYAEFGTVPAKIVDVVTRRKDEETYIEFIQRIKDSGVPDAITLKLADIADNTDPRRPRIESLATRYEIAKAVLLS